jgi:hypothetical protein
MQRSVRPNARGFQLHAQSWSAPYTNAVRVSNGVRIERRRCSWAPGAAPPTPSPLEDDLDTLAEFIRQDLEPGPGGRKTVQQALGQVADALCALDHDAEPVAASSRAAEVAVASLALQRSSYAAGKSTALPLIAAENAYSMARLGAVRAVGQRLSDTALLLVAVGGGWWNDQDLPAVPLRGEGPRS